MNQPNPFKNLFENLFENAKVSLKALVFSTLFALGTSTFADQMPSAIRQKDRDYREYLEPLSWSAFNEAKSLNTSELKSAASLEDIQTMFEVARDRKNLRWLQMPKLARRTTFLYPQDGCFLRAALMNRALKSEYWPPLQKIYAFGNLKAKTSFDADGFVYWYFHVALAIKYGSTVYVLDPSLEFSRALTVDEWLNKMHVQQNAVELRICDPDSYSPFDRCIGGQGFIEERQRDDHVQYYLGVEWQNLVRMGLKPESLLDRNPPWIEPKID